MEITFAKDVEKKKPFADFSKKAKKFFSFFKSKRFLDNFYYFLLLIAVSIGFYMLMLVQNNFSLAYGGDYSAQYIPMGYHIWDYYHEWLHTGHFTLFDTKLYLGANSIGSNSYYGLFSPFNIIIIILPRNLVPQAVAIASFFKLACAGLFFSFYMRSAFNVKANVSRICGIAYAFCGWGAFYLWYNNYQDILVFFPLVLWGIENVLQKNKPIVLSIGVFFLVICNYVLMVPYAICAFIYAVFRFFQRIKLNKAKDNFIKLGLGAAGFTIGLMLGMFVFMPAFMATMTSPKLDSYSYMGALKQLLIDHKFGDFFKLLFSWESAPDQHSRIFPTRALYPILEFFFPATTCRSLPTLEQYGWDFDDMAVSLWCYVPFIIFLVPALIQSGLEKKWSVYIGFGLLLLSLFTPFMYFLTMGMTNGYARWTLFIATSLIAYVGIYLDKIPNVAKWTIHIGLFFAVAGIVTTWILTYVLNHPNTTTYYEFVFRFIDDNKNNFTNLAFILELVYVIGVYLALLFTFNKKAFHILITIFVSLEAIAMGTFVTYGHGYDGRHNNGYEENERFRSIVLKIQKDDKSFYRFYSSINDAYSSNNSFINNYNTVSFFHSLYNFEIDDFTMWTGLRNGTKSVSGDYRGKYQDLDNLLGVKYYIISKRKSKLTELEKLNPGKVDINVPFGFERRQDYENENYDYLVYDNPSMSEFGYTYTTLFNGELSKSSRYDRKMLDNTYVLTQHAVVNAKDAEEINTKYPNIAIDPEVPENTTLKSLYLTQHYMQRFYDLKTTAKYYPLDKVPNIPNDFTATTLNTNSLMNYYAFYRPVDEGTMLFKKDTILYIKAAFSPSEKYDFYFLDENNKIFLYDCHDDDSTDNVGQIRAFYLRQDVKYMAVCGKYARSSVGDSAIRLYAESYDDYKQRIDAMNQYQVENVKCKDDKFTFTTNFDEDRFVVSRVAYDAGWSITAKDANNKTVKIKAYKGNGGFVSFAAPKGEYKYTMTYKTPYLTPSLVVSISSLLGLVAYYIFVERKHLLNKELYEQDREN